MVNKMDIEQQEIVNHALSSKENLQVAVAVCGAYNELKKKIIKDFSAHLEHLLLELGFETDFSDWNNRSLDYYTGFSCYKLNWPKGMEIRVEAQNGGFYNYIIGVKDKNILVDSQFSEILFNKCNEVLKTVGGKSKVWPWYKNLLDRYRSFEKEPLLVIYEKNEFSQYLLSEINGIAKVVENELANTK